MSPDQAVERIKEMHRTPRMWALTVEGFLLQVAVLLEVWGIERDRLQLWMRTLDNTHQWRDEVNQDHAEEICRTALGLLA